MTSVWFCKKNAVSVFTVCRPNPANKYGLSTRLRSYEPQLQATLHEQLYMFTCPMVVQLANAQRLGLHQQADKQHFSCCMMVDMLTKCQGLPSCL